MVWTLLSRGAVLPCVLPRDSATRRIRWHRVDGSDQAAAFRRGDRCGWLGRLLPTQLYSASTRARPSPGSSILVAGAELSARLSSRVGTAATSCASSSAAEAFAVHNRRPGETPAPSAARSRRCHQLTTWQHRGGLLDSTRAVGQKRDEATSFVCPVLLLRRLPLGEQRRLLR